MQKHPLSYNPMIHNLHKRDIYMEESHFLVANSKAPLSPISSTEQEGLICHFLEQGELALLRGDITGLAFFEKALEITPSNPDIFYRQGLALFEYGSEEGREKTLLWASKNFKMATTLAPHHFEAWHAWGNTLSLLGMTSFSYHYFIKAAEKLNKALLLSEGKSCDLLAELFWDYAIIYTKIAEHSEEAIDFQIALDHFQKSCDYQKNLPAEFWNAFGLTSLSLAELINDRGLHIKAINYFKNAISLSLKDFEGWKNLALALKKLYLQTHEDDYFEQANECFISASHLKAYDETLWLQWACLLLQSGKITKNHKRLNSCLEVCQQSFASNPCQPLLLAVWAETLALIGELSEKLDFIYEAQNKMTEALDLASEDSPSLCLSYGMCLNSFGKYFGDIDYYFQAIEEFQEGLSIDRTSHANWHAMAKTYTIIGDLQSDIASYEKACKFYAKAINLSASSFYIFDYALALSKLGEMKDNKTLLETALSRFEQALHLQKNVIYTHPDWLFHYATCLDSLGDFYEDEQYYIKATQLLSYVLMIDPDFPKIHHKLALAFSHLGEIDSELDYFYRALHHFRLASKYEEDNDQILLDWGVTLINISQNLHDPQELSSFYQEAEQKIAAAAKLGNEQAYYHLGCLYSLLENYEKSMHFIEKSHACKTLPPLDEVLEDEWLEGLRSTSLFQTFLSLFK